MIRPLAIGAIAVAALGAGIVAAWPALRSSDPTVPTARPTRGNLSVDVHARGELGPHQSVSLTAPPIGASMQLVRLAAAGTRVRKGDVVMAFDPERKRHDLAQARMDVLEAEQEILRLRADARVRAAEDQRALVEARFAVRIAEMKAAGNEFVGTIEARKNLLALEEAQQKVAQLEQDVRTHAESNAAALAALAEKRSKAELAVGLAERHIESMTVSAPIDGLVMIQDNSDAAGGFFYPGMVVPEYREGDTVQPGSAVAAIVDISSITVNAKLDEAARTALSEGRSASVRIDGLPTRSLTATVTTLGGTAARTGFWGPGPRMFEATFRLEQPDPALRSGMTAELVASADSVKNALHVPKQALFDRDGTPVVYARRNGAFVPVPVKVLRLTESRAVIEGISDADEVALSNPERSAARANRTASAPPVPSAAP